MPLNQFDPMDDNGLDPVTPDVEEIKSSVRSRGQRVGKRQKLEIGDIPITQMQTAEPQPTPRGPSPNEGVKARGGLVVETTSPFSAVASPYANTPSLFSSNQPNKPEVEDKPITEAPAESGDFFRGAGTSLQQTPALLKGAVGLVGSAGEKAFGSGGNFSALKDWGFEGYKKGMAESQEGAKQTDDVTFAWDRAREGDFGALVDWAQYGLGYVSGQVAETAATGILGGIIGGVAGGGIGAAPGAIAGAVGKEATKGLIKGTIEAAVAKEAAKLAAQSGGKLAGAELTKQATKNVASNIGTAGALAAFNITTTTGGIYGEAQEQADKEGRELTGADLSRVFATGVLAGAVESVVDKLGLDISLGKRLLPGQGVVGRSFLGGAIGAGVEGGTELIQTGLERVGAGKDLTGDDAFRDYINSVALGALGGAPIGAVAGAVNKPESEGTTPPPTTAAGTTPPDTSRVAGATVDQDPKAGNYFGRPAIEASALRDRMGDQKFVNLVAAIYEDAQKSGDEGTVQMLDQFLVRTSSLEDFKDAQQNQNRLEDGRNLFNRASQTGEVGNEVDYFLFSAEQLVNSREGASRKRPTGSQAVTEYDLDRQDREGRLDSLTQQGQDQTERSIRRFETISNNLQNAPAEGARIRALAAIRQMESEGFTREEADVLFGKYVRPQTTSPNVAESTQTEPVVPTPSATTQAQQSSPGAAVASIVPQELKSDFDSWLNWSYSDPKAAADATSPENLRGTETEFLTLLANTDPKSLKNKNAGRLAKEALNDLTKNDRRPNSARLSDDEINAKLREASDTLGDTLRRFGPTNIGRFNIAPEEESSGADVLKALADYMYWLVRKGARSATEAIARTRASFGDRAKDLAPDMFRQAYDDAVKRDQIERTSRGIVQPAIPVGTPTSMTKGLEVKLGEIDRQFPSSGKVAKPKKVKPVSADQNYSAAKSMVIANPSLDNAIAFRDALKDRMLAQASKRVKALGDPTKLTKAQVAEAVGSIQDEVDADIATLPERVQNLFKRGSAEAPSAINRIGSEVLESQIAQLEADQEVKIRKVEEVEDTSGYARNEKEEVVVEVGERKPVSEEGRKALVAAREQQIKSKLSQRSGVRRTIETDADINQAARESLNKEREQTRAARKRQMLGIAEDKLVSMLKDGDKGRMAMAKMVLNSKDRRTEKSIFPYKYLITEADVAEIYDRVDNLPKRGPGDQFSQTSQLDLDLSGLDLTPEQKKLYNKYNADVQRVMTVAMAPERAKHVGAMDQLNVEINTLEYIQKQLRKLNEPTAAEAISDTIGMTEWRIKRTSDQFALGELNAVLDVLKAMEAGLKGDRPLPGTNFRPSQAGNKDIIASSLKVARANRKQMRNDENRNRPQLFMNTYKQIWSDLQRLRVDAIQKGLPPEAVSRLFVESENQIQWANKIANMDQGDYEIAIDLISRGDSAYGGDTFTEDKSSMDDAYESGELGGISRARNFIIDLIDEVDQVGFKALVDRGIEEKEFTHDELVQAFRDLGRDPPTYVINYAGHPHMQHSLVRFIDEFGSHYSNAMRIWMSSLHDFERARSIPVQVKSARLARLSANEKALYTLFKRHVSDIKNRTNEVSGIFNSIENAFPGALFIEFDLADMENTSRISDPTLRAAIEVVYPSKEERVEQWMKDLALAKEYKPGFDPAEYGIKPNDIERYTNWKKSRDGAVAAAIRIIANSVDFGRLAQLSNLPRTAMEQYRMAMVSANEVERRAIEAEGLALHNAIAELRNRITQRTKFGTRGLKTGMSTDAVKIQVEDLIEEYMRLTESKDQVRSSTVDDILAKLRADSFDRIDGVIAAAEREYDYMQSAHQFDAMNYDQVVRFFEDRGEQQRGAEDEDLGNRLLAGSQEMAAQEGDVAADSLDVDGAENDDTRARRGQFSGVVSAVQVQGIVERLRMDNDLPPITVLGNVYQLPERLRERVLERHGANIGAKGLFDAETGHTYLFSEFMENESDVEFTIFHEIYGHYGIRGVLGDRLNAVLTQMYNANPKLKKMTDALMKQERIGKMEAIEEALADLAMTGEPTLFQRFLGRVVSLLQKVFPRVATWLQSYVDVRATPDVAFLLKEAKEYGRNGGNKVFNGVPGEIRLQEAPPPYEMYALKGKAVTGYARFNPIMQDWYVFTKSGEDVRDAGYITKVIKDQEEVRKILAGTGGKVEMRTRSAYYVDDNSPLELNSYAEFQDPNTKGWWSRFVRNAQLQVQNEWLPVFERVRFLQQKYGNLGDASNPMKSILLYEGRAVALMEDFEKRYVNRVNALLERLGAEGADKPLRVGDYERSIHDWFLIARHAPERNKVISNLTKGKNQHGSGIPNEGSLTNPQGKRVLGAKETLEAVRNAVSPEAYATLEQLGTLMDMMSRNKVRFMYDKGLITADQGKALLKAYKHYVPMKDAEVDMTQLPNGRKLNLRGQDARRSTGRGLGDIPGNTLENALLDFESVLIRGEKNVVANTILNMIERFPDPTFARVNVLKYRKRVQKDGTYRSVPVFEEDGSVRNDPVFGVQMRQIPNYEVVTERDTSYINNPQVMVVKVGGRPVTIEFDETGVGSFFEAIHGSMTNRDPQGLEKASEFVGRFNRFFGQMITSWNPVWVFVNGFRDVQTALFNAVSDDRITKAQAAQIAKSMPKALKASMFFYMNGTKGWQWAANNFDIKANAEMLQYLQEMRREGGLTLFMNRNDMESMSRNLRIALEGPSNTEDQLRVKFKALGDFMEGMTTPVEVMPRLAAYSTLRKSGWSPSDAAVFARELTVNFNMRGQAKSLRNLFLFFNPAIQGSAKIISLATKNPKRFASVAAPWIGFGFLMNMVARALGEDDEEDEDKRNPVNKLDMVPDYKRATSILISPDMPGGSIPLAYGWNAFYAMGHFAFDSVIGVQPWNVSLSRITKGFIEAYLPQASGLERSTGLKVAASVVTPTPLQPIVDLLQNENRYGAPIFRERNPFAKFTEADSYMHFDSVSPISRGLFRGLNELTGGNRYESGGIDVNPAVLDYLINAYLPGLGAESYKLASTATRVARGEEIQRTPLPMLDRFTAYVPIGFDSGAYRRVAETVETKYKVLQDPGTTEEQRRSILKEYPNLGAMYAVTNNVNQQVRRMNSNLRKLEAQPDIPDAEKVAYRNKVKEEEKKLYALFVRSAMKAGFKEDVIRP